MTSFTCVSWVCVLTLLFLGQSSDAEPLTEMDERRSVIENYVQNKLEALEKKLKTEIDENTALQSQVSNLNNEVKQLKEADKQLKEADKKQSLKYDELTSTVARVKQCSRSPVAFTAGLTPAGQPIVRGNQDIIYNQEISNIGNAYNTATGVFTCPVAGVYGFTVSVFSAGADKKACIYIRRNRSILDFTRAGDKTTWAAASQSVTLHLEKDDIVDVIACGHNSEYWTGSVIANTFTGFLLSADTC